MSTKRQKSGYRELQAVAKQLQLPGNVKYQILQQMVQARREGNEILVERMISEIERAKMRRRAEKYEARQAAYNHAKNMMGRGVVKQEHSTKAEESNGGGETCSVTMNGNQMKNRTAMDAYTRCLLLLPQEKRREMFQRRQYIINSGIHQRRYEPYVRQQCDVQEQFAPHYSSRSFRRSFQNDGQMITSSLPGFKEFYAETRCQESDHFTGGYMFESNGNYSTDTLNSNQFAPPPQELIVPFSEPPDHCSLPPNQFYEDQISGTDEIYDQSSTTTGLTQISGSPDSDTLSSDETRTLTVGVIHPFNDHPVQVEYRNDNRMPYIVDQFQDYVEDVQEILSDQSDSDALQINSSVESQIDSFSDVGDQMPPSSGINWTQGGKGMDHQNGVWAHDFMDENPPGNYIEL